MANASFVLISAADVAMARAMRMGTLRTVERNSRFGGTFWATEDDHGVIETYLNRAEMDARLAKIKAARAANHAAG